jgi:starch synthase (maltosyl-transferring)
LTITTADPLPPNVRACLKATLNSKGGAEWSTTLFALADERTLTCHVSLEQPGHHSFRAEFSLDNGVTWDRDTVPDAWILVDPPQVDGVRIYTMIPTVSGTIADWTADLERIHDMGFNAIHLLPVTVLDITESPYAARDLFDIDHSYLAEGLQEDSLTQLEKYISEAKRLGIRLCFDLVLNHVGANSDMARRAPDWLVPDQNQPDGLHRARYWSGQGWRSWNDLVLINYEHPSEAVRAEIWAYMTEYALFWARYANDTGGLVRFDNLHSSDRDFVETVTRSLHSEYPEVGLLAEYFTDERTLLTTGQEWGLNLILATPWNLKFVPQLREYLTYIHRVSEQIRYYMPITSHDSGAPAQEFGTADSTVPRYVAAALLGTGATGIPQGVEYGESERINFIGRKSRMKYPAEARFAKFVTCINTILAGNPAFRCGGNCQFVDDGHSAVIAAFRRDVSQNTRGFLVLCNFDTGRDQQITVDLAPIVRGDGPFSCCELISGEKVSFSQPTLDIVLSVCEAKVFMIL